MLLAVGCCAMWVPVPQISSPEKDRSEPYPCMDRPCGCASAEQCWKKCCCFTNQQKVAWAERNGVKVPEYVVAAAIREAATKKRVGEDARCAHCVVANASQKSSRAETVPVRKSNAPQVADSPEVCGISSADKAACVAQKSSSCCIDGNSSLTDGQLSTAAEQPQGDQQENGDEPVAGYFCGIAALECQGLTSLWQILSLTMLPERSQPEITGDGWSANVPTFNSSVYCCDLSPPEPPPRIGVAGVRAVTA
ncbi:MAG: hypothetical protein R3C59_26745 [Planctomycetaceae bacterium]